MIEQTLEAILSTLKDIKLEIGTLNAHIEKIEMEDNANLTFEPTIPTTDVIPVAPAPAAPVVPAPAAPAAAAVAAPTREQVGKALIGLATTKGREAAAAALKSVGAEALGQVKPEQYPAILAFVEAAQ